MIQWTGDRTTNILEAYKKYCPSNNPTKEECIKAEVNFIVQELKKPDYSFIYDDWKKGKNRTAKSAGETICRNYLKPKDMEKQAVARSKNAAQIYEVMKL